MKFVCLGFIDEAKFAAIPPEDRQRRMEECFAYDDELRRSGHFLGGEALDSALKAATLRMKDGKVVVTDGPFVETKETLGGILLLEARDLDHAIALMSKHPGVKMASSFEIRPANEVVNRLVAERSAAIAKEDRKMRVMVLVKASKDSEAGVMPTQQGLTEMGQFSEELVKAGILLAGEGLHPTSKGVRVRFSGKERIVSDGPFAQTKELVAGYGIWQVKSMDEAIAWVKRCPCPMTEDSDVEIRPIFSPEDFGEAATPELRQRRQRLLAEIESQAKASSAAVSTKSSV